MNYQEEKQSELEIETAIEESIETVCQESEAVRREAIETFFQRGFDYLESIK